MPPERDPPRRSFLKATGLAAISGAASLQGVSLARAEPDAEYALGSRQFAELKLEHDELASRAGTTADRLIPYVVDDSRVAAAYASPDRFQGDALLGSPTGVTELPATLHLPGSRSQLAATTDYRGLEYRSVRLADDYDGVEVAVETLADGSLRVAVEGREATVEPGAETTLALGEREVALRGESQRTTTVENPRGDGPATLEVAEPGPVESMTVQPTLSIRNHGSVDAYAADDAALVPVDAPGDYAQAAVSTAEAGLGSRLDRAAADLVVVPTGGASQ